MWTDASSARAQMALLVRAGEALPSQLLASDDFVEGPLTLWRAGTEVWGALDRTVVTGQLVEGRLRLRDAKTRSLLLEGELTQDGLRGMLGGEGRWRAIRSVAAPSRPPIPDGAEVVIDLVAARSRMRELRVHRSADSLSGSDLGAESGQDQLNGTVTASGLKLTTPSGDIELRWHGRALVGRAGEEALFSLPLSPARSPEPADQTFGAATVRRERLAKPTGCPIKLDLIRVTGTPHDAELTEAFERMAVAYAMGPWEPGAKPSARLAPLLAPEPVKDAEIVAALSGAYTPALVDYAQHGRPAGATTPTASQLPCPPGAPSPNALDSTISLAAVGGGLVAVQVEGYARFNRLSAFVRVGCYLVDPDRGTMLSPAAELPETVRKALSTLMLRKLRQDERATRLSRNGIYLEDAPQLGRATQLCAGPEGLTVQFQPGEITGYTPNLGPSVLLPAATVLPLLPADSVLRRALMR
jgi:hypothetical protein